MRNLVPRDLAAHIAPVLPCHKSLPCLTAQSGPPPHAYYELVRTLHYVQSDDERGTYLAALTPSP